MANRRRQRIYGGLGLGLLALAVVTIAIAGCGSGGHPSLSSTASSPTAPAAPSHSSHGARSLLAANTRLANQVLVGSIQAKVAQLRGVPVVINQWASWCTNCEFEFPFFQRAARQYANRVAFVGIDSQDSQSSARAFLARFPVNYPSVFDPSASQARSLGGGQAWPTTIYLNAKHEITIIHIGAYPTFRALQQDIARYT
jgi:thiol-disulfide isomerase/thioredoxin